MSQFELGLWSFPVLLLMIVLRAPIGLAMLLCGLGGLYLALDGSAVFMARLKSETYSTFSSYSLSIIPMFLLMGQLATLSGMSQALFRTADAWLGHFRGGLAMAAVGACAGFGAICGSSLATAATMGRVALPELRRHGYSGGFATATVAAGGTLGILIPPSVILVIYAILTEQNIARLFLAALVPGLLAALGYLLAIGVYVRRHPQAEESRSPMPLAQRLIVMLQVWPVVLIFTLVVGGIYAGWFTPTEGAAVGAVLTGLAALFSGRLSRPGIAECLLVTARNTAMIFFIILGAAIYNGFLALTQVPQELAAFVIDQALSPWAVLIVMLLFYLVFGCLMDSLSMILLTIPIFYPIIGGLDFGMSVEQLSIWFGILVLIVVEIGLITPPVGLNLFIINAMDRDTPEVATWKAVTYFVVADLLRVVLLVGFPGIVLFVL